MTDYNFIINKIKVNNQLKKSKKKLKPIEYKKIKPLKKKDIKFKVSNKLIKVYF